MMTLSQLQPVFRPVASPAAIVVAPGVRFTVLTSRLLRLEYAPANEFEDRPSQVFWNRQQPVPSFACITTRKGILCDSSSLKKGDYVELNTEYLKLVYKIGFPFDSPDALMIELKQSGATWRYLQPDNGNLKGTYRTLDAIDGFVPLQPGLISRDGWAVVDDSHSLVFTEQGWLENRGGGKNYQDLYFFGYGHAFQDCLRDFRAIAGQAALLPRWVLGNWWSRYWAYTQDEIENLITEFQSNQVPLSVFIIDMDWHITQTGNASSGWTGYTWNKELFPDYRSLLRFIHEHGLKTALNLHPAEGVYPHEEQYSEMARRLGVDPLTKIPIPFDIANPEFAKAYFEVLHHPYERDGIDFWWIDWQQGKRSSLLGLDPLFWLNHLHFHGQGRVRLPDENPKRPFIFSRWGGLGNHRYPIGFSGDTIVSWESLAFQPYFTATAANVGYGWWSHDIGGHWSGIEDPELYLRWVQFGLFSPILRLHSTKNAYHERRPYAFDAEISRLARHAMQLRHAFIPYLYTMSWQDHQYGVVPIRPLYHLYPEWEQAYQFPNVYTYGSELLTAPFTAPRNPETRLARQPIWLPEGHWFNFFSGEYFSGGHHVLYGELGDMPLFAKAGAIVPLAPLPGWGGLDNPDHLRLHIFAGADNQFELYEDDGESSAFQEGAYALTRFNLKWEGKNLTLTIDPVMGDSTCCPPFRTYELKFRGILKPDRVLLRLNGILHRHQGEFDPATHTYTLPIPFELSPKDTLIISLQRESGTLLFSKGNLLQTCQRLLKNFRLNTILKADIVQHLPELLEHPNRLARYRPTLTDSQLYALLETITRAGVHRTRQTGKEVLLVWNNGWNSTAMPLTYQLVVNQVGSPSHFPGLAYEEGGIVPEFKVFTPANQFHHHAWELMVNYFDVLQIRHDRHTG